MRSKLKNLLLAAMALTLFAGCSNIALNDAVVEGSDAGEKYVLTIGIDGFKNYSSSASRYVSPEAYDEDETFDKLTLSGTSNRKNSFTDAELTADAAGKFKYPLAPDVWYLTLKAYKKVGGADVYVLKGESTVDLRHGGSTVTFTLKTDGVGTKGTVELSGTFDDPDGIVKQYKAGLYNIDSDELITGSGIALTEVAAGKKFEYKPGVKFDPGSYLFKLTPYKLKVGSTTEYEPCSTVYAEMVDIAPGRTTGKADMVITGIETKPAAPADLAAFLVDSSEDDEDGFYTVRLSWTPKSYNEEGFILRLYKANDSGNINLAAAPYVTFKNKKISGADTDTVFVTSSDYRISGNLARATKECEIKLPAGELFEVTINSWNEVGEGVDNTNTVKVCTRGNGTAEAGETAFAAAKLINRTMVTYNLNGGTYNGTQTASFIDYFTYDKDNEYTLMDEADFDTTKLLKGTGTDAHAFRYWTSVIDGQASDKLVEYGGYKNLTVWASYNEDTAITVTTDDKYTPLELASVKAGTDELTATANTYAVHESDSVNSVTFTVGEATETFDEISIYLRGAEVAVGSGKTVTVDLTKILDGGKYTVTIIAKSGTKKYSCNTSLIVYKK